jgi:hypothetical protein
VTRVPIACTLTVDQAADRGEEWRTFLGTRVERVVRQPGVARLLLAAGDETLVMAADLAEREKGCCAFFTFAIELDGGDRWLRVEAPADAEPVLDQLFAIASG